MIATWPCPLADGAVSEELLVTIGEGDAASLLIIPPLFAEHSLMRRQLLLIMRALADAGITSHLPDLPGWNESLLPSSRQSLATWHVAMSEAARHLDASHAFAVRSGALLVPRGLKGWLYAPQSGDKLIRTMIRAQGIADREAGKAEASDQMMDKGRVEGLQLVGWDVSSKLFRDLQSADFLGGDLLTVISQEEAGGSGLWLRAEPGEDLKQAQQIASLIANSILSSSGEDA